MNNSKLIASSAPTAKPADGTRTVSVNGNRLDSHELFAGTRELIIGHGTETYRLRLTSQNKLILTK